MSTAEMFLLPVLEPMDWVTLQEALAAATAEPESAVVEPQEPSPAVASIVAEAESAYHAVATVPTDVTAYMEYAFDTAPRSNGARLERLITFAPTVREASELITAFANEALIPGDDEDYRQELVRRWWRAELGLKVGTSKKEWLTAIGFGVIHISLSPGLGPVDRELLAQLPRLVEIGAEPAAFSGDSFVGRLQKMLAEDAKKRQEEWNRARQARRDEQNQLNTLANRRRRRIRGERVEEEEDPREQEALLAATMRHWSPEMTAWAMYAARVKILGVQISGIIRNPLLSVEEKGKRIADAKAGRISWIIFSVEPELAKAELAEIREILQRVAMQQAQFSFESVPTPVAIGPASPWPLWPNLHLVESELHPIYQLLANLRVEFRLAETWAEAKRGPAEQRGRVDMIPNHATGPIPFESAADKRLIATFRLLATTPARLPVDHDPLVAEARRTAEVAQQVLGWWQGIADPAEKEAALPEVQYLIGAARKAERKLAQPLPGRAAGNRRRRAEKRLPLVKAARLRRKADAKAHKAPVAENKPRRKKDRAA